jgi:hypothetical protein
MITLTIAGVFELLGAGALGAFGLFFWFINTRSHEGADAGEGCLGTTLALGFLVFAVGLLVLALVQPLL